MNEEGSEKEKGDTEVFRYIKAKAQYMRRQMRPINKQEANKRGWPCCVFYLYEPAEGGDSESVVLGSTQRTHTSSREARRGDQQTQQKD